MSMTTLITSILIIIIVGISLTVYFQYENILNFIGMVSENDKKNEEDKDLRSEHSIKSLHDDKEVFHIANNNLTYDDAQAVCKQYGGELANYDQILHNYQHGGEFCNYGWSKNQLALFPTQKSTWEKLQKSTPKYRDICGHYGVNGGKFSKNMKFGANCYGKKPEKPEYEFKYPDFPTAPKQNKKKREFKNLIVTPFNRQMWSRNSEELIDNYHHTFTIDS